MTNTVISVENLSKAYQLGVINTGTFRGDLHRWWTRWRGLPDPFTKVDQKDDNNPQEGIVWALKDMNFQVQKGEALGIIGSNGAGKSTLLKILSRVTAPTRGVAKVKGRVASLLEIGTGFHPELTGRENIYMNGALLGMNRHEIQKKFDEIVDFAGIGQYIDTPVKRYSSGMYVRLGFAVAAHLEPEILIVDEVLAVGDAQFQKKCLGKMDQVTHEDGRTVLFVSHNMIAVRKLCSRAIWVQSGEVLREGDPTQLVADYLKASTLENVTEQVWENINEAPGNEKVRLHRVRVRPANGDPSDTIYVYTPIVLEFEYWNLMPDIQLSVGFSLFNEDMVEVANVGNGREAAWRDRLFPAGRFHTACQIPGDLLNSSVYRVQVRFVQEDKVIFREDDLLSFEIADNVELRKWWYGKWPGVIRPNFDWQTELVEAI